jgi:dTDP-4-amino-4,6-dideoxygalactose transaminase
VYRGRARTWAIVPTLTFLATANAVRYCGADVIFADVDPVTGLLRPEDLQKAIDENKDKNIKAVLPVHLGGHPADMPAIRDIAKQHGMMVIADCCHALGGSQNDHAIGSGHYEDMAVFSFHPVKTIAMGEGGAITTADADIAARLRRLRSHGMRPTPDVGPWAYDMQELGYNYRVTDIQCALGISQLKKLDGFLKRRRALADLYDKSLAGIAHIRAPRRTANAESGWHLYSVGIDFEKIGKSRTEVMGALRGKNIGTQVHYIPVHSQPYYQNLYGAISLPGAAHYYARTLSIPFYPALTDADVANTCEALAQLA